MPRIIQIIMAFIFLILLSPLFLVISLGLWIKGSVFFTQCRTGKRNHPFTLFKFRTMVPLEDGLKPTNPHATHRITSFGKILRRFSLDELPQLWNVIQGDMNLVGPRPLPLEYLNRMNETERKRHRIRPGITGWTQVKGRNALTWERKFEMDRWYVENRSAKLDLKILLMTLPAVFSKKGINQDENRTMEEYTGDGSQKSEVESRKPECGS